MINIRLRCGVIGSDDVFSLAHNIKIYIYILFSTADFQSNATAVAPRRSRIEFRLLLLAEVRKYAYSRYYGARCQSLRRARKRSGNVLNPQRAQHPQDHPSRPRRSIQRPEECDGNLRRAEDHTARKKKALTGFRGGSGQGVRVGCSRRVAERADAVGSRQQKEGVSRVV